MNYHQKNKKLMNKNGFTIIETLVAITVLMIAVAGPLQIASKGLSAALYAKDQMTATFLAQESMEVIKNKRDNNIDQWGKDNWLTGLDNCTDSNRCDASAVIASGGPGIAVNCSELKFSIILDDTDNKFVPVCDEKSVFKRYFYLEYDGGSMPPNERRAVVVVEWKTKTLANSMRLTSSITNEIR